MKRFLPPRSAVWVPALFMMQLACSKLTEPAPYKPERGASEQPAKQATEVKPAAAPAAPAADKPVGEPPAEDMLAAAHVLIAYQGAMRSQATRTKEEAQKLAQQVADQAKGGKDFAALAKQYSDDKGSGAKGGDLGRFPARRMVKQFADATAALKPGEISGVVESPFGFHVIRRSP